MQRFRLLVSMCSFCLIPGISQAATIFTDNFASGTPSLAVFTAGNFTAVGGTNVDLLGGGNYGYLCTPTTIQCVDLDGSGGNSEGSIQSNLTFSNGSYLLNFLLTGSGRGPASIVNVSLGSFNQTYTLASADVDNIVNQMITVTNPGVLTFTSLTPGDIGAVLDTVSVSTVSSPPSAVTPEPSSLILLGSAMLSGLVAKQRRAARA